MLRQSDISKEFYNAGASHALLNVHAAINDHAFLTKRGDVFEVIQMEGFDFEGCNLETLESICRRFEQSLSSFDERFRVQQYRIQQPFTDFERHTNAPNPAVETAMSERATFLAHRNLKSLSTFFVISLENQVRTAPWSSRVGSFLGSPSRSVKTYFSAKERAKQLEDSISRSSQTLHEAVQTFLAQVTDLLRPRLLDKHDAARFLRRLANLLTNELALPKLSYDEFVDHQIAQSTLECHRDHLRVNDRYVKILSLKLLPARTFAHMFGDLSSIGSNFVAASEWKQIGATEMRRIIQSKRRFHHNTKVSPLAYVGSQAQSADVLVDDSSRAFVADLGDSLKELEVDGVAFGTYSLTLLVYDSDYERLQESVAACSKVFGASDAQLFEETYNALNAFLAVFPANHLFNLRRLLLSATNYADLSFLFAVRSGERENKHLGKEHLAVLETVHGTPYFLNLHHQDVGHALVLGCTGSGKSFLLNFEITHVQKYEPYTVIFDLGGGFRPLTRLLGGSYMAIGGPTEGPKINPFVLPPTVENRKFLLEFVRVLIETSDFKLSAADEKDLFTQISSLYEVEASQRRLLTLSNIVRRPLQQRLLRWVEGGAFAPIFDNANDTLTFSRFQTFDFHGMEQSPQILEPLLFYVLHRANAHICDPSLVSTLKVFVIDEGWRFLKHPTTRQYIAEALKTWRKQNAAMILATQSSVDLAQDDMLSVIAESCPTKIFLANPGIDKANYRNLFHLTETEADIVTKLVPKRQLLLKRPDVSKLLNLNVDAKSYWLYTSDPFDTDKREKAFAAHGFKGGLENLTRSHNQ